MGAEWRWSDLTAITVESQIKLVQNGGEGGSATTSLDKRTTLEVREKGQAVDDAGHANIGANIQWAWPTFHLKVGAYFGDWPIPLIGYFVPIKFMPEVDASWRW